MPTSDKYDSESDDKAAKGDDDEEEEEPEEEEEEEMVDPKEKFEEGTLLPIFIPQMQQFW